ncbi:hypothetical protein F5X68DRAFT_234045 [Plectosphaerella plurivora]|uniref:BTB domain-containing protein n=1 Tax=Plectosphaerella plurivora TaxID=936078 RepID=A0A9P9A8W4_9PEZI|nr:hypothetical protein F5X68DRAFT_234045 [Plectosphaerella plurivora]
MAEVHVTNIPDVCLVLSTGRSEGLRIFANVAVLRNASPVFHTLLGPHFLEGHLIANNSVPTAQELEFPDDNPQGMLLILQILHQRFGDIQQAVVAPEFQFSRMRAIAVLADKYDVRQAISVAFSLIISMNNISNMENAGELWSILTASYIVGNRDVFKVASAALIMQCDVAYSSFVAESETPREFDMWICMLLEETRARLRAEVSSTIAHNLSILIDKIELVQDHGHQEAGHLFYYDDEDEKRHRVEDLMPQMAYRASLEKTQHDLNRERRNDPSGIIQIAYDRLNNGAGKGICFDCVGNHGQHQDHCMED